MNRDNPIAIAIDETVPSVLNDPKRTLAGFLTFANFSARYQEVQRMYLASAATHALNQETLTNNLQNGIAMGFWLGFESGKNYVINGHVDEMLALEDAWNKEHASDGNENKVAL